MERAVKKLFFWKEQAILSPVLGCPRQFFPLSPNASGELQHLHPLRPTLTPCHGQRGLLIAVDDLAQRQVTITYAVKTADNALGLEDVSRVDLRTLVNH